MLSFLFLLACSPSHLTVADLSAGDIIEDIDTGEPVDTGAPDETGEADTDTDTGSGDTSTPDETGEADTGTSDDTGEAEETGEIEDTGEEPTWCEANYDKSIATTYLVLSEGESVTLEPCGSILHEVYCYVASGTIDLTPDSIDLTDGKLVLTANTAGLVFDGTGSAYGYCILSTDPTEERTRSGELYVTITE